MIEIEKKIEKIREDVEYEGQRNPTDNWVENWLKHIPGTKGYPRRMQMLQTVKILRNFQSPKPPEDPRLRMVHIARGVGKGLFLRLYIYIYIYV